MSDTSLRFNFLQGKDTASPHMRKVAGNATAMSATMRIASAAAVVGMLTLGAAIAGVVAHAIALGQSAIVAAGAVAVLPAALLALIGVAIAGKVAFGGLGEAWKQTGAAAAAGGGAATDVAHRMELANRSVRDATTALADAQREALAAQEAVTRAREDATERLEDLSRSLRGARLDEKRATESLRDARKQLSIAKGSGDAAEVRKARIAYDEAILSLERARDSVGDLAKEQESANAKGVEGSNEVLSAAQRQEQSQRSLTAATERLADAQRDLANAGKGSGGADKAAQALAALAPSAREVVLTLRQMGPAWVAAGKGAQQAAFAGVAGDLNALGTQYLPRVSGWLYRMGDAFNAGFRDLAQLGTSTKFARDFGTSLEFIDQTTRRLMLSLRPLINGVMQFVTVGASFLPGIADDVGNIAQRFEKWAVAARETGQTQQWISSGIEALKQFWAVAKNLIFTLVAIFKAGENTGTLTGLVSATEAMRRWAESAEGQQKIADVLTFLRNIFTDLTTVVPAFTSNADILINTFNVFGVIIDLVASNMDTFAAILPYVIIGLILMKGAQTAANAASVVMIPLRIAEFVATLKQIGALRLHSAALTANTAMQARSAVATGVGTAATTAADAAQKRGIVSMAAMRIATVYATIAQWAHNTAWYGFPVVWIIAAIIAVIAVIVLIIMYHKEIIAWIGKAWDWVTGKLMAFGAWLATDLAPKLYEWLSWPWRMFKAGVAIVWEWIKSSLLSLATFIYDKTMTVVNFFLGVKTKLTDIGKTMWTGIVDGFKSMINFLIKGWNSLDFAVNLKVPDWIPASMGGGKSWSIPDLIPDLPYLDTGGRITQDGMAFVHRDEEVLQAAEVDRRGTTGGRDVVELRSDGSAWSDLIIETIRKAVGDRGGDVQFVLGR